MLKRTNDIFISNLKSEMIRQDLDYKGLAARAGLTQSGLYKIAEGHRWPSPDNLDRIARALGRSVSWLFKDRSTGDEITVQDALRVLTEFVDSARVVQVPSNLPDDLAAMLATADPDTLEAVRVVLERAVIGKERMATPPGVPHEPTQKAESVTPTKPKTRT